MPPSSTQIPVTQLPEPTVLPKAAAPAPTIEVMPTAPPPPPAAPMATAPSHEGSHSSAKYITIGLAMLIIGFGAGAAGGYYYATTMVPTQMSPADVMTPATPDQTTQTPPPGADANAGAGAAVDPNNPLDGVKTNPFQ